MPLFGLLKEKKKRRPFVPPSSDSDNSSYGGSDDFSEDYGSQSSNDDSTSSGSYRRNKHSDEYDSDEAAAAAKAERRARRKQKKLDRMNAGNFDEEEAAAAAKAERRARRKQKKLGRMNEGSVDSDEEAAAKAERRARRKQKKLDRLNEENFNEEEAAAAAKAERRARRKQKKLDRMNEESNDDDDAFDDKALRRALRKQRQLEQFEEDEDDYFDDTASMSSTSSRRTQRYLERFDDDYDDFETKSQRGKRFKDNFNFLYKRNINLFGESNFKFKGKKSKNNDNVLMPAPASGNFFDQFLAVMQRTFQQTWRQKTDFILELLVPLIFIIITIILWGVWGTEKYGVQKYINYDNVTENMIMLDEKAPFCYKDSPIGGLEACSARKESSYDCSGDEDKLPAGITGLCYPNIADLGAIGWVTFFTYQFAGYINRIMTFDAVVLNQWVALKSILGAQIALTGGGIAPNTRLTSIMCSGKIFIVAPTTTIGNSLVTYFRSKAKLFDYVNGGVYTNVADAEAAATAPGVRTWAIIQISNFDWSNFDVVIRLDSKALPDKGIVYDHYYSGGFQFDQADMYAVSGFLTLQQMVLDHYASSVMKMNDTYTHYMASMGGIAYKQVPLIKQASQIIPFIYVLAFLYPVSQLTKKIVLEKELKLRESMLIMGLSSFPLYLSWFLLYFLEHFVTCFIITILLKVTYVTQSDPFIIFLVFYLFALTTIPLSGLIGAFFSKARLASLLSPIIYFIMAIPLFAMQNVPSVVIIVFSLLSPTALAQGTLLILKHELGGGLTSNDFMYKFDEPSLGITLVMMGADFVIYYVLMLYLDAVMPKDWGTPMHPLFFLKDPFEAITRKRKVYSGGPDGRAEDGVFEDVNMDEAAVLINGLKKEFKRGGKTFVAVDNLYWGMNEGEISVLLGHNGAGKSTTMNMMTGMLEPDAGDCYIYGRSARLELSEVRQDIGLCPQHNILWPELTCREHLEFFAKIKGLKGWELEDAVCRMLYETDLQSKIDYRSGALSGGQKRKLSVAIAFVGLSRLVFLDEPTAGMDVGARRHTWELLRRMAASHTILLTTHYMDEADLLGHRIGIMSQGRLKCSGSSLFLKSRLGVGYSIAISIDGTDGVDELDQMVSKYVEGSEQLDQNVCEVSYRLPKEAVESFPRLLASIEASSQQLGVRGYSLSATTLEEIFISVSLDSDHTADDDLDELDEECVWDSEFVTSSSTLAMLQFKAMMKKRFYNALRDRRMQCFQVVCPIICILIAMLLGLIKYSGASYLKLSNEIFPSTPEYLSNLCMTFMSIFTPANSVAYDTTFVNALNVSSILIDYWSWHSKLRVGAFVCNDVDMIKSGCQAAPIVQLYNSSSPHQAGVNMATFYESKLIGARGKGITGTYTMAAGTLPTSSKSGSSLTQILMGAIIMIPFSFLPSNPVAWVVKERECKSRHLQNLCGLKFFVYWIANFLFDMAAYIISIIVIIIIFAIFQRHEYTGTDRIGATIVLFLVYGLTSTVMAYAVSFLFNEHSMAQTVVMAVSFVAGFLLVMVVYILSLVDKTRDASDYLRWPFRLMPSYSVGEGIINLAMLSQKQAYGNSATAWSLDTTGYALLYMGVEFPVFFILTLLIDHPYRRVRSQKMSYDANARPLDVTEEDSDVEAEREAVYKIEEGDPSESVILVSELMKKYPNGKVAVRNISFGIKAGQVFGFLGTNGAGKTTTISILCQEFLPSSGRAYVCGYDLVEENREALQCIGYCPQFDATLDLLTVEEHLYLFAGIRGIVEHMHRDVVETLMEMCGLEKYRQSVAHELSGGNRRKLSVAMALIGGPRVVFLDEPSAGMDPVARRGLWTTIQHISQSCSVVLTTHHLEEVEALADTVAIMVDGTLRCIGDKTHLKNKYGSGFEMSLRIDDDEFADDVENFVMKHFPKATLNEYRSHRFVYALPPEVSLARVFDTIQLHKDELGITDYSVSQTSIEQVFLRISGELD